MNSITAEYTVTEHANFNNYNGAGYGTTYSVRLPDVQQMPGAAIRYLEAANGRRRSWRTRSGAQREANSLNVWLRRALAKRDQEALKADEQTLAQKIIANVNYDAGRYQGMICREDRDSVDVEFPSMQEAVDFVAKYNLDTVAHIRDVTFRFNVPVVVTLSLADYAQITGIEV